MLLLNKKFKLLFGTVFILLLLIILFNTKSSVGKLQDLIPDSISNKSDSNNNNNNNNNNINDIINDDTQSSDSVKDDHSIDDDHNNNDNNSDKLFDSNHHSDNKDNDDELSNQKQELELEVNNDNNNQLNDNHHLFSQNEEETYHSSDPESPEDSSYAKSESENDSVDEEIIKEIIEEYEDEINKDLNPADPNKDWSINVDPDLLKLTTDKFIKGDKISKKFFSQLLNLIYGNRLSFPLQERMIMENGKTIIDNILFYSEHTDRLSESDCNKFLNFPENFINDLKIKHKIIVDNIPDIDPTFYSGSGYVIVGGGKYSWFSFLVIETLRKLGSVLPVEVIIPTNEEYEVSFCEKILPKFNARCIKLHDVFDEKILNEIKVTGYQYKSLALLASSFENAFLLDSDNYPVVNPDPIFTSEVYNEFTMITWPDYWRRTTSPKFYEIRGSNLGNRIRHLNDFKTNVKYFKLANEDENESVLKNRVPLHDREGTIPDWTTESGEMLINKKIHFKALILALYYNLDGQFGYYPLLSQGGAGEGDKETFVAASNFYNLNYYQVNKMPDRAYGFYKYNFFYDTSIIQYNPIVDYENLKKTNIEIENAIAESDDRFNYDYSKLFVDKFRIDNAQPMFYHVHETKMDPFTLYEGLGTQDLDGKKMRNLGGDYPRVDFDLELFLWKMIEKHVCIENTDFVYFYNKDKDLVCGDFMKRQLEFLDESGYELLKRYISSEPYENLRRVN
ncbi:hypothetical protein C6P42_003081 [Pichia californica]|nr:hypothetical protein C6P42_003081 [[Candida] californica]